MRAAAIFGQNWEATIEFEAVLFSCNRSECLTSVLELLRIFSGWYDVIIQPIILFVRLMNSNSLVLHLSPSSSAGYGAILGRMEGRGCGSYRRCFQLTPRVERQSPKSRPRPLKSGIHVDRLIADIVRAIQLVQRTGFRATIDVNGGLEPERPGFDAISLIHNIYPRNRPWGSIGLWDAKDPTLSRQSAHRWRWSYQPYAPAELYSPETLFSCFWYSFLLQAE
jgi:hypothetical protein